MIAPFRGRCREGQLGDYLDLYLPHLCDNMHAPITRRRSMEHRHVQGVSGAFLVCMVCGVLLGWAIDRRPHGPGDPRMTQEATMPPEHDEGPHETPTGDSGASGVQEVAGNSSASATGVSTGGGHSVFSIFDKT